MANVSRASALPSFVRRVFSETIKRLQSKFCVKVLIHQMSRLFSVLKILDFLMLTIFFSFWSTWDPIGMNITKCSSFHISFFFKQTFSKYFLWQSWQKLLMGTLKFQILKKIAIFVNMGPYGYENFKATPPYSYHSFSRTLYLTVPCDILCKSYLLRFWNFKLYFEKKMEI